MSRQVGIWIDDTKAVIVSASAERITSMTVESDVGPDARHSAEAVDPATDGPRDAQAEKRYERRFSERLDLYYGGLDRYYGEVIGQLGEPNALLIFGPGEAKLQLEERLRRSKVLPACIVEIETTDKLTDPQIVAKVRKHYKIVPPAGSAVPASVRGRGTQ
jgi:hypothetical protein